MRNTSPELCTDFNCRSYYSFVDLFMHVCDNSISINTRQVVVAWPYWKLFEMSAVPVNRLCCGPCLGLNVGGGGGGELGGTFHCTRLTDHWTVQRLGGGHQHSSLWFRRSGRSLAGPWENKRVRLHLFSVSVPGGIKGEDISSRPAWLSPTHLRGPFSPHSLWALFTHPADMACGTVAA